MNFKKIEAWARRTAAREDLLWRAVVLGGTALLLVSSVMPWFRLPVLPASSAGLRFPTTSVFQLPFQILCGLMGLGALVLYRARRPRSVSWGALALLLVLASFPYLVMLHDPPAATVATELQDTNDQLINETMAAVPNQMQSWKRSVNMLLMVRPFDVLQLRIPNAEFLSITNLDIAIIGFGYSDEFLDFMGWGYPFAVAAALMLLSGAYLGRGIPRFTLFRSQCGVLALGMTALLTLGAAPVLVSNYLTRDAEVLAAAGLYADALKSLASAGKWLPVSALSTKYHGQVGEIRYRLRNLDDPDYHLYLGNLQFDAKRYEQASVEYAESVRIRPNDTVALHSLSAALTNYGIQQYGRGEFQHAISSWELALRADPMNTKALYEVQIGYFQVADFEATRQSAFALIRILETFRLFSLSATAQSYVHLSWCAYRSSDYDLAFTFYRQSVEPTLW